MAENFDVQQYYRKLANHEAIPEADLVKLLKAVETYQAATAYLADCQAATLSGLPKSTSKSARGRHIELCKIAASLLDGNVHAIRYRSQPDTAQERCRKAVHAAENECA